MSVNNRPQHSTSTTYTLSFTAIAYKSYNFNTKQITIKNKHHNPQLLPIPPKSTIYFLDFIMSTFCSSVIITIVVITIIVPPSLFSLCTDNYSIYNIYATFHQIIIILYSNPNHFPTYNTNIEQYSIVYCNTIYPNPLIFIAILVYHTISA